MVDHDQKGIKTIGKGKIGDQITRDLLEWARAGGRNREEWGVRWMGVNLILLAHGTSADITPDIGGKARPPKLRGNKLASFEDARVAGSGVVMVAGYDSVAQAGVGGDVDTVLVSQDACIVTPIGKAGAESGRGSSRESMEGIENEWVRSRGGAKLVREGSINEVDKECFREEGDRFIVCVGCGDMIWVTG